MKTVNKLGNWNYSFGTFAQCGLLKLNSKQMFISFKLFTF